MCSRGSWHGDPHHPPPGSAHHDRHHLRVHRFHGIPAAADGGHLRPGRTRPGRGALRHRAPAPPPPRRRRVTISCESKPGGRTSCPANTSAGVVLVRSRGDAACLLGRTWGYDQASVWVSDGCSADFATGAGADTGPTKQKAPSHVPNVGFLLFDGEKGQVYFRLMSYGRYLNQRNLDETYVDAFGNTKTIQRRQDVQLQKFFAPFSGWFLTPKMRYYLYVWSSNPSQGDPAQVVGAGNLTWGFNRHVNVGRRHHLAAERAQHRRPVPLLARRGRSPDRRRVLPRLVHLRRVGQGRDHHDAQVQRDVRQQPEHARGERVAARQQVRHAGVLGPVAPDHGRVRPVGHVRRLRRSPAGRDAGRPALHPQPSKRNRASPGPRASRTARSASPTAASSSRRICSGPASPSTRWTTG